MLVLFARSGTGSTIATVHRGDGVVLQLPGYDRKHRVPHDLAHFATERALGMPAGVFGTIAAGAVFGNMRLVSGRPRHDAAQRSRLLLDAHKRDLTMAEVVAGVVHRAVEQDDTYRVPALVREAWVSYDGSGCPWSEEQAAAAADALTAMAVEWEAHGSLRAVWPDDLVAPMPEPHGVRRGRRGRT
ncbi:hypothetical protein [Actinoplanes sp. DH11]|uniref:hypothetical protein n=1 Tax=Actinoplanes sp. DH11 TaxID=2857011 RepID=UPI001E4044C4|nr:hypothetical protein [Actinoplanes sp. DH11]